MPTHFQIVQMRAFPCFTKIEFRLVLTDIYDGWSRIRRVPKRAVLDYLRVRALTLSGWQDLSRKFRQVFVTTRERALQVFWVRRGARRYAFNHHPNLSEGDSVNYFLIWPEL